jgi:hypothetical protein
MVVHLRFEFASPVSLFQSEFPVVPVMLPSSHILRQPVCRQNSCHKKYDMKIGGI